MGRFIFSDNYLANTGAQLTHHYTVAYILQFMSCVVSHMSFRDAQDRHRQTIIYRSYWGCFKWLVPHHLDSLPVLEVPVPCEHSKTIPMQSESSSASHY